MKIAIRPNTFETNSSSVHSIVIISPEDWNEIRENDMVYMSSDYAHFTKGNLYPKDEVVETYQDRERKWGEEEEESLADLLDWYDAWSMDGLRASHYEYEVNSLTTPKGENIIALCYFGHD